MNRIVTIDPSISCTGIAFGTTAADVQVVSCASKPSGDSVPQRLARFERLVADIERYLEEHDTELILIEGYAFGSKNSQQHKLAEFGGLLRWHLLDHCPRILEVPPACLKQFATGKGNAKKDMVMAHVADRWDRLFENSDQADAYVLFRLGLVIEGREKAGNQIQRDVVRKVVGQ